MGRSLSVTSGLEQEGIGSGLIANATITIDKSRNSFISDRYITKKYANLFLPYQQT